MRRRWSYRRMKSELKHTKADNAPDDSAKRDTWSCLIVEVGLRDDSGDCLAFNCDADQDSHMVQKPSNNNIYEVGGNQ